MSDKFARAACNMPDGLWENVSHKLLLIGSNQYQGNSKESLKFQGDRAHGMLNVCAITTATIQYSVLERVLFTFRCRVASRFVNDSMRFRTHNCTVARVHQTAHCYVENGQFACVQRPMAYPTFLLSSRCDTPLVWDCVICNLQSFKGNGLCPYGLLFIS